MDTVDGIVMMSPRLPLSTSTTIPSRLRLQLRGPGDSETTEDADPSSRWMMGLRQVVIQTRNIFAALLMDIAEELENIAHVTHVSTTDHLVSQEIQVDQCH